MTEIENIVDDYKNYEAIENIVFANDARSVKDIENRLRGTVLEKRFPMAIQTAIACGGRDDLEKVYPEFKFANPMYSFSYLPTYRATAIIAENIKLDGKNIWLDMEIRFGFFKTREVAEEAAKNVDSVVFIIDHDCPKILITTKYNGQMKYYYLLDEDIKFKKLKDEKQQMMGEPIDCSTEEGTQKAINALLAHDPSYTAEEDDFELFDFSLEKMEEHFRHGYDLQNIAYGTFNIKD